MLLCLISSSDQYKLISCQIVKEAQSVFFALSAPLAKAKVTLISVIPSNRVNVNIRQLPAAGREVTQIKRDKMNNK